MGMMIFSGVLSLGLIWVINALARSRSWGMGGACFFAIGATVLPIVSFCLFLPAFALQSALTFVLLVVCAAFRLTPKAVLRASFAAMAVSYGYFLWDGISEVRKLSRLRLEYPLESVADRLAYEAKATREFTHLESPSEPQPLDPKVEHDLALIEQRSDRQNQPWSYHRRAMLASLHTRKSDEFAIAQGFGRVRMMSGFVSAERIALPETEPIAIPATEDPPYDSNQESPDALVVRGTPAVVQLPKETLLSLHESGQFDFVDPDRIGFVKDRNHVAGFRSHRFTKMPELTVSNDQTPASWQIARLELVSLLKHELPVAYVSKNLPQMDELRDAPTRTLDRFEQKAIDRLRSDEDVMIDETPERIRMVGSLRAARNCLECHSVRRGELLGALTYELVPVRPTRKKPSPEPVIN